MGLQPSNLLQKILNLPSSTSHKLALKLANQLLISERIEYLAQKWLKKAQTQNEAIIEFLNKNISNNPSLDKYTTPYKKNP